MSTIRNIALETDRVNSVIIIAQETDWVNTIRNIALETDRVNSVGTIENNCFVSLIYYRNSKQIVIQFVNHRLLKKTI